MTATYSLLVGLCATLLVLVILNIFTIIGVVKSWFKWYIHIKQIRSLPSPPGGHWLWGHIERVCTYNKRAFCSNVDYVVVLGVYLRCRTLFYRKESYINTNHQGLFCSRA